MLGNQSPRCKEIIYYIIDNTQFTALIKFYNRECLVFQSNGNHTVKRKIYLQLNMHLTRLVQHIVRANS